MSGMAWIWWLALLLPVAEFGLPNRVKGPGLFLNHILSNVLFVHIHSYLFIYSHPGKTFLENRRGDVHLFKPDLLGSASLLVLENRFPPSSARYEGGIFTAILKFPPDFPNNPPEMRLGASKRWAGRLEHAIDCKKRSGKVMARII